MVGKPKMHRILARGVVLAPGISVALILGGSAVMAQEARPVASPAVKEISEQQHALRRRESGDLRPFSELLSRAKTVGRGEYLGVEPDLSTSTYRFKFMGAGANVIWVDVDGRTGRVLSARQ